MLLFAPARRSGRNSLLLTALGRSNAEPEGRPECRPASAQAGLRPSESRSRASAFWRSFAVLRSYSVCLPLIPLCSPAAGHEALSPGDADESLLPRNCCSINPDSNDYDLSQQAGSQFLNPSLVQQMLSSILPIFDQKDPREDSQY